MKSLIKAIQALVAVISAIAAIFTKAGSNAGQWLARNVKPQALAVTVDVLNDAAANLAGIADAVTKVLLQYGSPIAQVFTLPAETLAEAALLAQQEAMASVGESTADNALQAAGKALATAFGFGLSSAATAATFEAALPERLNVLDGIAPMLADLADFKGVAEKVIDPLYSNAFGKSLEYHYRSIYKPDLPDEQDAVRWHSQRLLTDDKLRTIFGFSGLKAEYEAAFVASAYRAIQPRALTSLFEDQPFPENEVRDMLAFSGVRQADLEVMVQAYKYASLKNVRNQYLSSVVLAAERGVIDDTTLDADLDDLNFSADAKNLVHLTVATRRLAELADLYRKQVTALYESGQITDAQYVPALQAVGIGDADAEAHFAVDSAKLKGRELAAAARAEARFASQLLKEQIANIKIQYLNA